MYGVHNDRVAGRCPKKQSILFSETDYTTHSFFIIVEHTTYKIRG